MDCAGNPRVCRAERHPHWREQPTRPQSAAESELSKMAKQPTAAPTMYEAPDTKFAPVKSRANGDTSRRGVKRWRREIIYADKFTKALGDGSQQNFTVDETTLKHWRDTF